MKRDQVNPYAATAEPTECVESPAFRATVRKVCSISVTGGACFLCLTLLTVLALPANLFDDSVFLVVKAVLAISAMGYMVGLVSGALLLFLWLPDILTGLPSWLRREFGGLYRCVRGRLSL